MTDTLPYSTTAGYVTRGETFAQLLDYLHLITDDLQRMSSDQSWAIADYALLMQHLTLAEEAANVIGHLFATEGNVRAETLSHGWLGIGEMLHNNKIALNHLAQSPHINRWPQVRDKYLKVIHHVKAMHKGGMQ